MILNSDISWDILAQRKKKKEKKKGEGYVIAAKPKWVGRVGWV
jgi:hypothetical protein